MAADAREVAETYFAALSARDLDGVAACWAPEGVDNLVGQAEAHGPQGVRAFFGELFEAVPDFALEVDEMVVEEDRAAVLWHAGGTFAGAAAYQGIAPTGGRVTLSGIDLLRVQDGLIVRNDAFPDGMGFARQIGMFPAQGSGAEEKVLRAFNARTRAARRLAGTAAEPVADGVWRIRGGVPRNMNVYLIEDDGGGVTVFDAGVESMVNAISRRRQRAGRDQPGRARPRAPGSSRRGAATGRAGPLPPGRPGRQRGRRRAALLRLPEAAPVRAARSSRTCSTSGTAGRSRSPARSRRART